MSMIGNFGLYSKDKFDEILKQINNTPADTGALLTEIHDNLDESSNKLMNGRCSGEIFIALFQYFKEAHGMDVREKMASAGLIESWLETTGDFDIVVFYEKEKLLSLENTLNYDEISQYINEFYEADCQDAGRAACEAFFHNLKETAEDKVLIWHLC